MNREYIEDDLKFRFLNEDDYEVLVKLIDTVYDEMEDKSIYIKDSNEEVYDQVTGKNDRVLGVFNENNDLIAFRHMELGVKSKQLHKYVKSVHIPEEGTIYHGGAMVHKDYRGRGLQNKTRMIMEKTLEEEDFFRFTSTISPKNVPSMKNVFKSGFTLVAYVKEYPAGENNFEERFVFYSDFKEPLKLNNKKLEINLYNIEEIEKALDNRYVGVSLENDTITFIQLED